MTMDNINLEEITHKLVIAGPMSAKAIAKAVRKPYSSLMRELNPYDRNAKLGANTFVRIMEATGDTKPLRELAEHFGMVLTPMANADTPHGAES